MLFPEQPYTRYRFQTEDVGTYSNGYNITQWSGTVAEPWKVTSQTFQSGGFTNQVSRTMHDAETPGWRKAWLRGLATVNPMEQTTLSPIRVNGRYYMRRVKRLGTYPNYYYQGALHDGSAGYGDSLTTNNYYYPSPPPPPDESIIQEAITECWSKVSLSDTLVLAQAAELSKTLAFLTSTYLKFRKIMRDLKRMDVKALKGELSPKELSQRYMEARYALRPLAYDLRNTASAYAEKVPPKVMTFRAHRADISTATESNKLLRTLPGDQAWYGSTIANESIDVRVGVLAAVTDFSNFTRWGCGDILQTIWEEIPFSFIVDWFFQVGKLISMWSPKVGLRTLASWYVVEKTTTLSSTIETVQSLASGWNYTDIITRSGTYSKVSTVKYRLPNPDRPVLPSFNVKLNSLKLLDLGIIATGVYNSWFNRKGVKTRPRNNPYYAWFDKDQSWFVD